MEISATTSTIRSVWDTVVTSAGCPQTLVAERIVAAIVQRGWVASYQIEDLIYAQGCRTWASSGRDTCKMFGVPQDVVFTRPAAKKVECLGFPEVRAANLAMLLILMERFGFPIDPAPLVAALLPTIRRQAVVNSAELHCLWYAKERHRLEPVIMMAKDRPDVLRPFSPDRELTLSTGYRAEVWSGEEGPARLVITKPKRGQARTAA